MGSFTVRTIASKRSPTRWAVRVRPLTSRSCSPPHQRIKEGGAYDFLVAAPETSMLFKGSANWIPGALADHADALFLGIGGLGRARTTFGEDFLDATIGTVQPAIVIPTHWNDFFCPVHEGLPLQRKLVDNTPAAFDTVLARTKADGVDIGLLEAFASIMIH